MNIQKMTSILLIVLSISFMQSCDSSSGTGGSVRDTTSQKAVANGTGGSVRDTTSNTPPPPKQKAALKKS